MSGMGIAAVVYGIFLLIILIINLLYIFQILKFRLPGDASLTILSIHILMMIGVIIISSIFALAL